MTISLPCLDDFTASLQQELFTISTANDSASIRVATANLSQKYFSCARCVPALVQIISQTDDQNWPVKQMAAVELRKRTPKWWSKQAADTQLAIKQQLMHLIISVQNKAVRNSIASVVAAVAKVELPQGKWTDLMPNVYAWCRSQVQGERECGYFVIDSLLEVLAETFGQRGQAYKAQLMQLLTAGLQDTSSQQVQKCTLQALSKLAELVEPADEQSIAVFRDLVPQMVNVLQAFLLAGLEEEFSAGIEVFDNLISMDVPILTKHVAELLQFFLSIGANVQYTSSIRVQALNFIMWASVYKKNKIQKLKLVAPIIQCLMPIGTEEDPEDEDDDAPSRLAFKVLNSIALSLPPQQVFTATWELVTAYMQPSVTTTGQHKAAMMAIAALAEGCSDYIRNEFRLENVMPFVVAGLNDTDVSVRRGACIAMASLANEMGPSVSAYHATVLPLVFQLLNDSNQNIRQVSLETVDTLLENLGDKITPYLPGLMDCLARLLEVSDNDVKTTIVSAIGSAAHASDSAFQPYFAHVMTKMQKFVNLSNHTDEDEMMLRGVSIDTTAAVAIAVGAEMFAPYLQHFMDKVMESIKIDDFRLPECAYCFFASMAKLYTQDFAPFLPSVVEKLFAACELQETDFGGDEDGVEDLGAEVDDDFVAKFQIGNAIAEEKECAIESLGVIFEHCKQSFMPYLTKFIGTVQELCDSGHENVRKACIEALYRSLTTIYSMHHENSKWIAGLPAKYQVHNDVVEMIRVVMTESMKMYEEEEDKVVVATMNQAMTEALKELGPVIVADVIHPLSLYILALLEKKAVCQVEMDGEIEEAADEDDDQAEYDALVISSTADLIGMLSTVIGPELAPFFPSFWPLISKYYKPSRPISDRSMAIGVTGEIAGGLGAAVTPYTREMLSLVMQALNDEDDEVRSNAAFATGTICRSSTADLSAEYPHILGKLAPLFSDPSTMPNIVDNACGAVSRMILARPAAVPLSQVLPVLFSALPLKKDNLEYEAVLELIFALVEQRNEIVMQNLQGLVGVCRDHVLAKSEVVDCLKSETVENVKLFVQTHQ